MGHQTGSSYQDIPFVCVLLMVLVSTVTGQLQFDAPPQTIHVQETTPKEAVIGSLKLKDGDGLKITSENPYTKVNEINRGTSFVEANITLATELDYDREEKQLLCTFSGTDKDGVRINLKVILIVGNVNDETPVLKKQPYSVNVPENANISDVVFTIFAEDIDLNDVLNYTLTPNAQVADPGTFTINTPTTTTTESLLILRVKLDFETVRFYQYTVTVTDLVGHNNSADVFITVVDVQDTPPFFTGEPYQINIPEDETIGNILITVKAADGDRGVSNGVTLNITNETCKGLFQINPTSGEVSLKAQPDRDSGEVNALSGICTLEIEATEDNQHPQAPDSVYTATTSVTITITDVNDNAPMFSKTSYTITVDENTQQGVPINLNTPINVTDIDQGNNAFFEVKVTKLMDYFEVTPSQVKSTGEILIRVKNSTILDYETNHSLSVELEAKDKSGNTGISTATVNITINNINDNIPKFSSSKYSGQIEENSVKGTPVIIITATDADENDDNKNYGTVTYSLEGSDSSFEINKSTGQITVGTGKLDREMKDTYYMTVVAEDGGHSKASAQLEINITDDNDNTPIFVTSDYQASLKEGDTTFSFPVTVHATDNDEPNTNNSDIIYSILNTSPQGLDTHFVLDPVSGNMRINSAFDYENISFLPQNEGKINVTVEAKDKGSPEKKSTVSVVVILQDINDHNPSCNLTENNVSVQENVTKSSTIIQVDSTDNDATSPNKLVMYSIDQESAGKFIIDSNSGWLSLREKLDREETIHYNINVTVTDFGVPPLTGSCQVFVDVLDINDSPPVFDQKSWTAPDFPENTEGMSIIITAKDKDSNFKFFYNIDWQNCNALDPSGQEANVSILQNWIEMDPNTGNITNKRKLDREIIESFTLAVTVKDVNTQTGSQVDSATVTVHVTDQNDNKPVFSSNLYEGHIQENMPVDSEVVFFGSLTVTDKDKDVNSEFSLNLTSHGDIFSVSPISGTGHLQFSLKVQNSSRLDYEMFSFFNFEVTATETKTREKQNSSATVNITVVNTNDNMPVFEGAPFNATVLENQINGTLVTTVKATDADRDSYGVVFYSLPNNPPEFRIDSGTGKVFTCQPLDREKQETYTISVKANDIGNFFSTTQLTITVQDENDETPQFIKHPITKTISENSPTFVPSLLVEATDADAPGTNSQIKYTLLLSEPSNLLQNFSIDPNTGEITLNSPLDYESLNSSLHGVIVLHVQAEDQGTTPKLNSTIVTITVNDINDVKPEFTQPTYTEYIKENLLTGGSVTQVTAVDHDASKNNNEVRYMIDTLSGSVFHINDTSGDITLKSVLDFETQMNYSITVTALDNGNPVLTSTANVQVNLLDVNDVNPFFFKKQMPASSIEQTGFRYNCTAYDVDEHNDLVYSIQWNISNGLDGQGASIANTRELINWVTIDNKTGEVTTLQPLNREKISEFVLQILVVDIYAEANAPQMDTGTLTIKVEDLNDEIPTFTEGNFYQASIRENMPIGSYLKFDNQTTMEVYDADEKGKNSEFKVKLLTEESTFEISPQTGTSRQTFTISIKNSTALDYEETQNFSVQVLAFDPNNSSMNSTATILVNILNENDNIPEFIGGPYAASVLENSTSGAHVTFVNATDKDRGIYGELTYTLKDSSKTFDIHNTTGEVFTITDHLDRENISAYTVTLIATDKGNFRATTQLIITLIDVNDNAPIFPLSPYILTFDEETTTLLPSFSVKATDADDPTTENSQIEYYLLNSTSLLEAHFNVDINSGMFSLITSLNSEAPDLALNGTFILKVIANDKGTPQKTATTMVIVNVKDINDNLPIFQNNSKVNVSEGAFIGDFVVAVNATDSDVSPTNNKVTYKLDTLSEKVFTIDTITGNITVRSKLDREQTSEYNITVTALDNGQPIQASTTVVHVAVIDVNDSPPVFTWDSRSETVFENQQNVITQNLAKDPDEDPDLVYSILWSESTGVNGNGAYISGDSLKRIVAINSSTGEVYPVQILDREAVQRFQLTLVVEDKKNVPGYKNNDTAILTVVIKDENDYPPTLNGHGLSATIQENMPVGSEIKMINISALIVTDLDSPENSMYNITLEDSSVFKISPSRGDGITSCVITVIDPSLLDYELRQNISITVIATEYDNGTLRNDNTTITVFIQNINDNFPKFESLLSEPSILENSSIGDYITTLKANDADLGEYGKVHYFIDESQTDFIIDNITGHVTLNNSKLDRELKDSYTIRVKAKDTGNFEGSTQITIKVDDVNDESPIFQQPSYTAEVKENDNAFRLPVIVKATDADDPNTLNSKVSYSITRIPSRLGTNPFRIDNTSGEITVLSTAPDYENLLANFPGGHFQIEVTATDLGHPPLNSSALVNVTITDINDVKPLFNQSTFSGSIVENSVEGKSIATVNATDSDGTNPNNEVYYVIQSGSRDKLQINSTSGEISVGVGAKLDRETTDKDGFSLIVLAIDKGSPPLTGTATVSITVLDENDVPPTITPTNDVFTVMENSSISSVIGDFNATDEDENPNLRFAVIWSESHAYDEKGKEANSSLIQHWLEINDTSGTITVKSEMDREQVEQMILKVVVVDRNAVVKPQEATATVTVSLLDVNDNPPKISSTENVLHINVSEGTKVDTEVTTLTATDADKGQAVSFSIKYNSNFSITAPGKLTLANKLDRETVPQLIFHVIATDNGSPALSSNITVIINVLDINDNDPVFVVNQITFHVLENSNNTTWVAKISANDADDGDNGNVTFEFQDTSPFRIHPISGDIYVSDQIDREKRSSYTLAVIAADNPLLESRRRASLAITIEVDDDNDNAPVFPSNVALNGYRGLVSEKANNGTPVTITPNAISATDVDVGNNSLITFSLINSSSDFFSIDPVSGEVLVKNNLRGFSGDYSNELNATDHGSPALWTLINLTITILDENINIPQFVLMGPIPPIPECTGHSKYVYTFQATDADKDKLTNGKVQYFLDTSIGTNHSLLFDLDPDTGVLTTTSKYGSRDLFDREIVKKLVIQVMAKDNGIPPNNNSTGNLNINVTDINDNPPAFDLTIVTNFSVKEGLMNHKVGSVKAFDKDEDSLLSYKFSDIDALWKDYFNITTDENEGGIIQVIKPLDREVVGQIKMKVTATDVSSYPNQQMCDNQINSYEVTSAPLEIVVTVEDVNDNPPIFQEKSLSVGFLSSTKFGEKIIFLQGHVQDNDTAKYSVHNFYQVGEMIPDNDISRVWTKAMKSNPIIVDINGTVITNYKFSENSFGYFTFKVLVNDTAGNDTIALKIYVVGESQVIHMTLWYTEDELRKFQGELTESLGQIGYHFVPDNILPATAGDGSVDPLKSVLVVHAVDSEGNIIKGQTLITILDESPLIANIRNRYRISKTEAGDRVGKHEADNSEEKTRYILIGVIGVIAITFVITLYLLIHTIRRFKIKLRAATLEVHGIDTMKQDTFPGLDNEYMKSANPMFMRDDLKLDDSKFHNDFDHDNDTQSNTSENSLDQNAIHSMDVREKAKPTLDEQEMTLDLYGTDEPDQIPSGMPPQMHFRQSQFLQPDADSPYETFNQGSVRADSDGDLDETLNMSFSNFESTEI